MEVLLKYVTTNRTFIIRLVVAVILGGLVGMERQKRGRAAGLRTNILVCLGSAGIIVAFQKLAIDLGVNSESAIRMDPARAAAGVITGIGFLGAGTIVKIKDFVRGLTTAASIWVVSAIGVTVGLGEYTIAVSLTILVLITLYVLHHVPIRGDRYVTLQLKWNGDINILDEVTNILKKEKIIIKNLAIHRQPKEGNNQVTLILKMRKYRMEIFKRIHADKRFEEVIIT